MANAQTEKLIESSLTELARKVKDFRGKFDAEFFRNVKANDPKMFIPITVKDSQGKEHRVLPIFLALAMASIKKHQAEVITSAQMGKRFGEKIARLQSNL